MELPSAHTPATLATYMLETLEETAKDLGWTVATHQAYRNALRRVLRAYGVTTVEAATDAARLEALSQVEIWRSVVAATVGNTDVSQDGNAVRRSQMHAQARGMLRLAIADLDPTDKAHYSTSLSSFQGTTTGVW